MARITIEDCMEQVPNRFHLVRMASIRAKQLKKGARPLVTGGENKEVVTSLREIAAGLVKPGDSAPPADALAALEVQAPLEVEETRTDEAAAQVPSESEISQPETPEAEPETPAEG